MMVMNNPSTIISSVVMRWVMPKNKRREGTMRYRRQNASPFLVGLFLAGIVNKSSKNKNTNWNHEQAYSQAYLPQYSTELEAKETT